MKKQIIRGCILFLFFAIISGCNKDNTVSPPPGPVLQITSVQPDVLSRGEQAADLQIAGSGFISVNAVSLGDGVSIRSQTIPDSQHIRLAVDVTKKATLGPRTVIVSTSSGAVQLDSAFRVLSAPPEPSFSVEPRLGTQLTTFTFDASGSTDPDDAIKSYHWEFGDGKSARGMIVNHKFDAAGSYRVELQVKDQDQEATAHKKVSVELWDIEKEKEKVNQVVKHFLTLFDDFENLPAEEVVVDFSENPNCPGRAHEIEIINNEKQDIKSAGVQILGDADVYSINEETARCTLAARFYGTRNDGSTYDGIRTHDFYMVNEEGIWRICNFTVSQ